MITAVNRQWVGIMRVWTIHDNILYSGLTNLTNLIVVSMWRKESDTYILPHFLCSGSFSFHCHHSWERDLSLRAFVWGTELIFCVLKSEESDVSLTACSHEIASSSHLCQELLSLRILFSRLFETGPQLNHSKQFSCLCIKWCQWEQSAECHLI